MAGVRICEVAECGNLARNLRFCPRHHWRWKRHGSPTAGGKARRSPRRLCSVEGCDGPHQARGVCFKHYKQWEYHGFSPSRRPTVREIAKYVDPNGYIFWRQAGHPQADRGGRVLEHRAVMAEKLGRPLVTGESVHHINGDRADNCPENLELWVTTQPSGQRPSDLLAWAHEIIARYGDSPA